MPAYIIQAIFRSLYLSTEEKKQILHYLKANVQVSVTEIRGYITNRFQEYETMINALGPPVRQKYEPKLPRPVEITAGAAITDGGGGGQDGEDEVRVLDAVAEVGEEEGSSGRWRWIPRMGTLELLRLKRKRMRDSPPLVLSVSPRNGHKVLMLLVPALGSLQPASQT